MFYLFNNCLLCIHLTLSFVMSNLLNIQGHLHKKSISRLLISRGLFLSLYQNQIFSTILRLHLNRFVQSFLDRLQPSLKILFTIKPLEKFNIQIHVIVKSCSDIVFYNNFRDFQNLPQFSQRYGVIFLIKSTKIRCVSLSMAIFFLITMMS